MSVKIKYVPLTFIKSDDEILRQIKNTVYFSFLFNQFEETTLSHYLESTQYGYTASASPVGTHQLLRITDINSGTVDWQNVPFCNCDSELKYLLRDEDILIARTGGTTGKSFIVNDVPNNAIFASYLIRLRLKKDVDIQFINCFLNSYTFWSQIIEMKSGSAMPNVNAEKLKTLKLPKCDLKTQQEVAAFTKNEVNEIGNFDLLQKIASVESIFNTGNNISIELNNQLDIVKQLRQSFLREAMQGELLGTHESKKENQETGHQLLEKIKADKAALIKDKKLKKEKELPPIKPEEIPFKIPENWVWCRLGEVAIKIHYGMNASAKPEKSEIRLLRITDIQENNVDWNSVPGCDFSNSDLENFMLNENDILIARTGGTIGKTYLVKNIKVNSLFASYLIRVIPMPIVLSEFLKAYMESPLYWKQLYDAAWGAGQPNVNGTSLSNLIIPLPPFLEQKSIMVKLEELDIYINQLQESIKRSQQQNEQLLQQVLREALEVKARDENTGSTKQIIDKREEAKIIKLPVLQTEEDFYYQKRKALATYILNQSLSDPGLGDTKLMKLLHLADYHAIKRNLGQRFFQKAAGPYDNAFILEYFKEIETNLWFVRVKRSGRFYFSPGINHNLSFQTDAYFSQVELNAVDQIITYFKRDNYERPEIVSTLYAVWNNRIIKGEQVSDDLLKQDFLKWNSQKEKYQFRLNVELKWMKDKGIIPDGWGKLIAKPLYNERSSKR